MSEKNEAPVRKRGRPPGQKKTGGRQKGVPNRDRSVALSLFNKSSVDAAKLLDKIMRGQRVEAAKKPGADGRSWWYPTPADRMAAAKIILAKSVPDRKASEISGAEGVPLTVSISLA